MDGTIPDQKQEYKLEWPNTYHLAVTRLLKKGLVTRVRVRDSGQCFSDESCDKIALSKLFWYDI